LRTVTTILIVLCLSILTGCPPKDGTIKTANSNKETELLTVDFNETQTLRYKFVSDREITINWEPSKDVAGQGQPTSVKSLESMEMDAVENFAGKTYTLKVGPTGKIEDYTQLDKLIKEVGTKTFRSDTSRGRIKEPDMIGDFIASQWFLWDSVASIENASEGVSLGQSWQSKLSVPTPMVLRKARDVTYKLEEIRQGEEGRLAVISSSYSAAETVPQSWPVPYTGRFQMSGKFGFLGNYQILDLQGSGEELFNITSGRTEQYTQHYQLLLQASIPLGIGEKPNITIIQNLTMDLLED